MTRRPESTRVYASYDGQDEYGYCESVALDVALSIAQSTPPQLDELTSAALLSFHLFSSAFLFNYHLATYFIARCCYEKDTKGLTVEALRALYKSISSGNNDFSSSCIRVRTVFDCSLVDLPLPNTDSH